MQRFRWRFRRFLKIVWFNVLCPVVPWCCSPIPTANHQPSLVTQTAVRDVCGRWFFGTVYFPGNMFFLLLYTGSRENITVSIKKLPIQRIPNFIDTSKSHYVRKRFVNDRSVQLRYTLNRECVYIAGEMRYFGPVSVVSLHATVNSNVLLCIWVTESVVDLPFLINVIIK